MQAVWQDGGDGVMANHRLPSQVGKKFGKFTILREVRDGYPRLHVEVICDCGTAEIRCHGSISKGNPCCKKCFSKQCALNGKKNSTHGLSNKKLYDVYKQMLRRCYTESSKDYKNWGGRGIKVCDEWRADIFKFFEWANKSGYKEGVTIERLDVNNDYCPENCTWIANELQSNNRTDTRFLELEGVRRPLKEWCKITGLSDKTIRSRIRYGWSLEKTLTTPLIK